MNPILKVLLIALAIAALGWVVKRFVGYKLDADREDRDADRGDEP